MLEHLVHHALGRGSAGRCARSRTFSRSVGEVAQEDHREGGEEDVGQRQHRGEDDAAAEQRAGSTAIHPSASASGTRGLSQGEGPREHEAEEQRRRRGGRAARPGPRRCRAGGSARRGCWRASPRGRRCPPRVPERGHPLVVLADQRHARPAPPCPASASAGSFRSITSDERDGVEDLRRTRVVDAGPRAASARAASSGAAARRAGAARPPAGPGSGSQHRLDGGPVARSPRSAAPARGAARADARAGRRAACSASTPSSSRSTLKCPSALAGGEQAGSGTCAETKRSAMLRSSGTSKNDFPRDAGKRVSMRGRSSASATGLLLDVVLRLAAAVGG